MTDPRPARAAATRGAIVDAFAALAQGRRYDAIRIADVIAAAGVGRATFYDHFRGKDDVLLAAMEPVLLALATAASGRAARSPVEATVRHLWDRRSTGRVVLGQAAGAIVHRRLVAVIGAHGGGADPLTATAIAAAQLAMLRGWMTGEVSATTAEMTDRLIACSRLRPG